VRLHHERKRLERKRSGSCFAGNVIGLTGSRSDPARPVFLPMFLGRLD
jgi:hypothetical protein